MGRSLRRLSGSMLARNTLWMSAGFGARTVLQVAYFVVIARVLGAQGYGAFVGVAALAALAGPFSGWGSSHLLVREVSRDPSVFRQSWGTALAKTLVFGAILLGLMLLLSPYLLPGSIPLALVFAVGLSDLIFLRVLETSGFAFLAFKRLGWTAQFQALLSLTRLVAALALIVIFPSPTPMHWGLLYLTATGVSAGIAVWVVCRTLGPPKVVLSRLTRDLKDGFHFSVSISSQNVNNDVDKAVLARFSTLDATGIYTAAYRMVQVSFTPVRALGQAAYARFFEHGSAGIGGTRRFAGQLVVFAGGYGLLAGVSLFLAAPLLPYLLGAEYQDSVGALRWLALLPFLKAVQYFAADALTGAGFQGIRSGVQVSVALLNVLLNLLLVPLYSWKGAAVASLTSDFVLMLGLWLAVFYLHGKGRSQPAEGLRPAKGLR